MEYEAKQAVYLPVVDYLNMELHLLESRPGVKPEALVAELVRRWLATETGRQTAHKDAPAARGFQWKNVFLPEGTILRTAHDDTVAFAKVVGDHIISDDGTKLTPSLFANRHAVGRNAWRFVWLRFPGDDNWVRAHECRARSDAVARLKKSREKIELSKTVEKTDVGQSNTVYAC